MFTRHKLNSIWYGPQILALVGLLIIVVPSILYLVCSVLGFLGLPSGTLWLAIEISLTAGVVLLVLFTLLLAFELIQDHQRDKQIASTRNRKLKISDEFYECQFCGNRQIRQSDKRCSVCGQALI